MLKSYNSLIQRALKTSEFDVCISFYVVWVLSFLLVAPIPSDDLLRDIIAGNYNYDYSSLYIYAPLITKYNQYIGFDILLHHLKEVIGKMWTVRIVQVIAAINIIVPCHLIFARMLRFRSDRYILLVLLLAITFNSMIVNRIYLGRPEVLFAGWVCWGLLAKEVGTRIVKLLWVGIGILMIPLYWLAVIYMPVALIVFNKLRNKVLVFMVLNILNALFWQYYSDHNWVNTFSLVKTQLANRYGELVVTENNSILFIILSPGIAVVICSLIYKFAPIIKEDLKGFIVSCSDSYGYFLLLIWFILPNMIRYCDVVVPILVIIFIHEFRGSKFNFNKPLLRNMIVLISCFSIFYAHQNAKKPCRFSELPENARVLTTFNGLNYYVPFFNDHKIQIAPCMEIGANEVNIQRIINLIQTKGKLNCHDLDNYNFNFVVEKSLIEVPPCLEIYGVNGEYRIWKVKGR